VRTRTSSNCGLRLGCRRASWSAPPPTSSSDHRGEKHGYEVAEWIHTASADALEGEEGALTRNARLMRSPTASAVFGMACV
jgi:hypothetical protein